MKNIGKPYAGKLHVRFEEEGLGYQSFTLQTLTVGKEHQSMVSDDDWRLRGQEEFLEGKTLFWRKYTAYSDEWEHDHCSFCWDKFAEGNDPDQLHEGYATDGNYYWVCETCFKDFREMFDWKGGS